MADAPLSSKCIAEFLGTYLLVLTVGCNVMSSNAVWGGVSIACILMVSIYALGGISGANFNPAVSFALLMARMLGLRNADGGEGGLDAKTMGIYWGCQLLGGFCGGMTYRGLYQDHFTLGPSERFGWLNAGIAETLYTFMLCFVVLNVAALKEGNQWYGLAIGFVIVAGAYGAGGISGGCFNPAVAFGIDGASGFKNPNYIIIYTVFELIGAGLAAVFFKIVRAGCEFVDGEAKEITIGAKAVSEFLGTFILVLTVGLNVNGRSPAAAFSIAAALMSMIYALGGVSGAHFNPAVTLAIFATNGIKVAEAGVYVVSQVVGGIFAAFVYTFLYRGRSFSLSPKNDHGWTEAAIAEIVFTFVLCYVVLCVAVSDTTKSKHMYGLIIGSCVTVGGFAIGGVSGGSLNPAVSWGIAAGHGFADGNFVNAVAYTAFEAIAGAAAAGVFKFTHAVPTAAPDKEKV